MAFDKALERLRRKKGMQVPVLARQSGISQSRLKTFERGTEKPTLTEVLALSYVLETSPTELEYVGNGSTSNESAPSQEAQATTNWDTAVHWNESAADSENPKKKTGGKKSKEASAASNAAQQAEPPKVAQPAVTPTAVQSAAAPVAAPAKEQPVVTPAKAQKAAAQTNVQGSTTAKTAEAQKNSDEAAKKRKAFGAMLKSIREAKKIPYSRIKEELGIELIDYVRLERGVALPSKEVLEKIIKLFELK